MEKFGGARGPARTVTPAEMFDVRIVAGGEADLALPPGHTALALVTRGPVVVNGGTSVPEGHLVRFRRSGGSFRVAAAGEARLLVLGGAPIAEPVVGHGPFVMNTRAEIAIAIDDFQRGAFGRLE